MPGTASSASSPLGLKPAQFEDLDHFRLRVSGALSPHTLRKASEERFAARFWAADVGRLGVIRFRSGAALEAEIPEQLEYFDFIIAQAGSAVVRMHGVEYGVRPEHCGVLLPPNSRVEMRLGYDFDQLHLRVSPATLLTQAERLLGRSLGREIVFETERIDLLGGGAAWTKALAGIADDGMNGVGAAPHPLLVRRWEELLLSGILLGLPHSASMLLDGKVLRLPLRVLRLAVGFIEANLGEALSVGVIADAVDASARSLQRGFREHLGTTPMAFVEGRRLAAVRDELLRGGQVSIGDVAHRWGFAHLSRFAAKYAQRYGELPSETLRGVLRA